MQYTAWLIVVTLFMMLPILSRAAALPYIAPYRGDARAAISFTFDDGSQNQALIAAPLLHTYHMPATFYIIPGLIRDHAHDALPKGAERDGWGSASWDDWKTVLRMGHEIGCHSMTHMGLAGTMAPDVLQREIVESAGLITRKLGQAPVSFAYPYNAFDDNLRRYVLQWYPVDRVEWVSGYGDPDPTKFSLDIANRHVDDALQSGAWIVPLLHAVERGYVAVSADLLQKHLQYIQDRRTQLWVDTVANIGRYIQERDHAQLTMRDHQAHEATFMLTCSLDPHRYAVPLTIAIPVDGPVTRITTRRHATKCSARVVAGKLLLDVVPGVTPVTVRWR